MDKDKIKGILECLFFVTNHPLPMVELEEITGEAEKDLLPLIQEMRDELVHRNSSIQVVQVAEGYQYATKEGFGYWVKKLFREQMTFRLSQSALETLSIVAYKQPITRAEIEEIRGVEVIGVLETLVERKLVKIAGRKETVGRPLLYATTQEFLRHFNMWKISDLPSLEDLAKEVERQSFLEESKSTPQDELAPVSESDQANGDEGTNSSNPAMQNSVEEIVKNENSLIGESTDGSEVQN